MNIVSVVVMAECDLCKGKGSVPGGQREYGEMVSCMYCGGKKVVPYNLSLEEFKNLVHAIAAEERPR